MRLSTFRPKEPTNLVDVSSTLRRRSARRSALPGALPDPMLLSVARDLRSLESSRDEGDQEEGTLAAPMMLVLSLMFDLKEGLAAGGPSKEITVSETALFNALKSYQWAVEREIVTRITGVGGEKDEEMLLRSLEKVHEH